MHTPTDAATVPPTPFVTEGDPTEVPALAAQAEFTRIFSSAWVALGLSALVEVGAVNALDSGPLAATEIARRTGCDLPALTRFLRAGRASGVFAEPAPGVFALTALGRVLSPDTPGSLGQLLRLMTTEEFLRPWARASETLRTGEPAFNSVYGTSLYAHLARNPGLGELFQRAMDTSSATDALLAAYDFSADHQVVDVGGGHGSLLAAVLAGYPHLTGTLMDQPQVIESAAQELLGPAGVLDRCTLIGGSFFEQVPQGGDVYLLSRVLHNWNDADAVRVLRTVRAAMSPDSHLLIVGLVPDPADRTAIIPAVDLMVLTILGGHNRSRAEFTPLLAEAGLREYRFTHHADVESVLDVVPG